MRRWRAKAAEMGGMARATRAWSPASKAVSWDPSAMAQRQLGDRVRSLTNSGQSTRFVVIKTVSKFMRKEPP